MSTRGTADVVFCIDASASMAPCINAVRTHIASFVEGLTAKSQQTWDLRVELIAHCASTNSGGATTFSHRSLFETDVCEALYQGAQHQGRFFTTDIALFSRGLQGVSVQGDEAPLVALDFCLDLPWRSVAACRRVVIMMTDEPFEQGAMQREQKQQLSNLITKIHDLRVMLFLVAPDSPTFDELASADGSEYEVIDQVGKGLREVDFSEVLRHIGKSISISTMQAPSKSTAKRGLFGQESWGESDQKITGR